METIKREIEVTEFDVELGEIGARAVTASKGCGEINTISCEPNNAGSYARSSKRRAVFAQAVRLSVEKQLGAEVAMIKGNLLGIKDWYPMSRPRTVSDADGDGFVIGIYENGQAFMFPWSQVFPDVNRVAGWKPAGRKLYSNIDPPPPPPKRTQVIQDAPTKPSITDWYPMERKAQSHDSDVHGFVFVLLLDGSTRSIPWTSVNSPNQLWRTGNDPKPIGWKPAFADLKTQDDLAAQPAIQSKVENWPILGAPDQDKWNPLSKRPRREDADVNGYILALKMDGSTKLTCWNRVTADDIDGDSVVAWKSTNSDGVYDPVRIAFEEKFKGLFSFNRNPLGEYNGATFNIYEAWKEGVKFQKSRKS